MGYVITPAVLQSLQTSFSMQYRQAYSDSPVWNQEVATLVPSSSASNTYGWMNRILSMREWLGPRLLQNVSAERYVLANRTFEASISVRREDIEDDNLGIYNPIVQELGRAARKWPDQLARTALQAGVTNLGFDDQAFFSATHDLDPAGNQTNNNTGRALTPANYATTREAMMCYTGEDGEPLAVMPDLLVVPPQLEREANEILRARTIADPGGVAAGVDNVNQGSARPLVLPELCNEATTWYLMDSTKPIKPFVWQLRRATNLVNKTSLTDDNVFFENEFVWGVDGRGEVGYTLWFLASRNIA